ncbi:nucleoside hydrolase [Fulvivirga sedimenti]|uniref:Nucleoside hydrolase n=1 Tax=Fulvivirga sedimenti TaxID=2879465 RepID=A0A9X1KZR1_9BACT|nr:nucleoside hydrolase [Fulvivirga sedimenti]MCA6079128.1 nucleoside hydrolase [Fulvivirga sedimenti]
MMLRKILLSFLLFISGLLHANGQQKVWLDTDTGNEMDDLYALVRLVLDPDIEVVGISSAHFNNPDLLVFEKWNAYDAKTLNTVEESQRLNEELMSAMQITGIPLPLGADRQIGRAWGQQDPRDSPAVQELIRQVKMLKDDEFLDVLTLGALTNIASAVIIAPEILPRIRVFSLGARYNPNTRAWNKNEFNIRNDLNAFDYLLNLEGFDFTVMPLDAAFPLQFDRDNTYEQLKDAIPVEKILADRWRIHNPQDKTRIMWDLALVEAYLKPGLAKIAEVNTPPENKVRNIRVYTWIDHEKLAADFWKTLNENRN